MSVITAHRAELDEGHGPVRWGPGTAHLCSTGISSHRRFMADSRLAAVQGCYRQAVMHLFYVQQALLSPRARARSVQGTPRLCRSRTATNSPRGHSHRTVPKAVSCRTASYEDIAQILRVVADCGLEWTLQGLRVCYVDIAATDGYPRGVADPVSCSYVVGGSE